MSCCNSHYHSSLNYGWFSVWNGAWVSTLVVSIFSFSAVRWYLIMIFCYVFEFAYYVPCSFGNLYGPPKSSGDNTIKGDENWYATDDTTSSASIASSSAATKSSSRAGAACAAHSKCKALGLTGTCCPHDGVMLGCCD